MKRYLVAACSLLIMLSLISFVPQTMASYVMPGELVIHPNVAGLGYENGFKLQSEPSSGTYPFSDSPGNYHMTIDSDGNYFSWASDLDAGAVIVKGGAVTNLYKSISVDSSYGDWFLYAPIIIGNNALNGITGRALAGNETTPAPEPATLLLLGSGLVGLIGIRRRPRKR